MSEATPPLGTLTDRVTLKRKITTDEPEGGEFAVFTTLAIVAILVYESSAFFDHVSLKEFLTDTMWTPLFADAHYGILPLVAGTLTTTIVALVVAVPLGTTIAIYLSEFAPYKVRETVKPILELLGAVPTVVYGYFALTMVTPVLQILMPDLPGFNMLSAGLVIGLIEVFWSAYFSVEYKDVAAFAMLAVVLIFLPQGLLGKPEVEKV